MTKYIVTAPDGKEFEVETDLKMTDRLANEVLHDAGYQTKGVKKSSDWAKRLFEGSVGVASAIDEGKFLGLGKKALSAASAAGAYPIDRIAEALGVENTPSFADRYKENVDYVDNARRNIAGTSPFASAYLGLYSTLKNPLYKGSAKFLDSVAKGEKGAKALGKQMVAGGVTNTALAEADDALRGQDSGDDTYAYGLAGAVSPAIAKGSSVVARKAGDIFPIFSKAGKLVDKTQTDKKVKDLVEKYGEGFGNLETIGSAARPIVSAEAKRIEEMDKKLYNRALRLTNMRGEASLDNTTRALAQYLPDMSIPTQNEMVNFYNRYLRNGKIINGKWQFGNPLTVNQLNNTRDYFYKNINVGGTEEHAKSEIYNALKKDLMESVKKHAKSNMGDEAVSRLNKAFDFHKERIKPRGVSRLLSEINKENKSESEIGNAVLNMLSDKKLDSKKVKEFKRAIERSSDEGDRIKKAIIGYINNDSKFNTLSKKGKEFVYGNALNEAEDAFNNTFAKKAQGKLNSLADILDSTTASPYMTGLIRLLFNK